MESVHLLSWHLRCVVRPQEVVQRRCGCIVSVSLSITCCIPTGSRPEAVRLYRLGITQYHLLLYPHRQPAGGGAAVSSRYRRAGARYRGRLLRPRGGPPAGSATSGQDGDQPGRGLGPTALPRSVTVLYMDRTDGRGTTRYKYHVSSRRISTGS